MIGSRSQSVVVAVLAALVALTGAARAATRGPVFDGVNRSFLPHIIPGADLPRLQNAPLESLRVFADWGDGLQQIPYQIDERTLAGKYVLDDGEEVRKDERPDALDADDELVVLLRDAGLRVHTGSWPSGVRIGREIELSDPVTGRVGYIYIFSFDRPPTRSQARHIQYDRARDIVTSAESRMGFHPKYPYVLTDVGFAEYVNGGVRMNLIDRLKVRIRGRTLGNLIEIAITEEDVKSHIVGTRSGPVRVIREIKGFSKLGPVPEVPLDIEMKLYPRFIRAPVSFTMPGPIRTFLSDMDVLLAVDLRDLRGGTFSTLAFNRGTLVDGKTTRAEQNVELGDEEWMMVTGKGINFYGQVVLDRSLTLKKEVHFIDSVDGEQPPESVPGQLPEAGFKLVNWHSLEGKSYVLEARIAALEGFPRGGGSGVFKSLENGVGHKATDGAGPRVVIAHDKAGAAEAARVRDVIAAREKSASVELMLVSGAKSDLVKLADSGAGVVVLQTNIDGAAQYLAQRGIRSLRASTGGSLGSVPPDRVMVMIQQCLNPGATILFPTGKGRDRSLLPAYQKAAATSGIKLQHVLLDEKTTVAQALGADAASADAILIVPDVFWTESDFGRFHSALEFIKGLPRPKPVFVTGRDGVAEGALLGLGTSAGNNAEEVASRVIALLKGEGAEGGGASASPAMQMYINPATLRWGKFKLPIQIIKNATHVASR
ncbi:MAG: hypothetical protein KDH09_01350 [Chrysiogenetes bacterium]|nr:hypothetical protein [Chrysiogenetes bacterium]